MVEVAPVAIDTRRIAPYTDVRELPQPSTV
jgi:hypothetical protein